MTMTRRKEFLTSHITLYRTYMVCIVVHSSKAKQHNTSNSEESPSVISLEEGKDLCTLLYTAF
jgi:hypothetical protein